jgi:hypothetical protein
MNKKVENIIRKLVFIPELLLFLLCYFRYRKVDYFQYKTLAKNPMRIPHIPILRVNLWYGNYFAVKKLSNEISLFKDILEHGVNFFDRVELFDSHYIDRNKYRNVYTFSKNREDILQSYQNDCNVVSVGPYILGANFFHSMEKRNIIKKKYGKILLVFPVHSTKRIQTQYNREHFIDEIFRIRHNFQSVFICLYFSDIVNKKYTDFLNSGFTIVTAGTREDIKFLSRLKDLIYLSDMTMSNNIGTHIGYSICMNRPHYLFYQSVNYNFSDKVRQKTKESISEEIMEKERLFSEFLQVFGSFSWDISMEQISICRKYWGDFPMASITNK